ncbi:MAG: lipoyl(octanoyl) transferase LipB [Rhodothermia bacterium]|nr:lipoyl(octanoyl) transferase LipB [Rhodothermia bacterium]
MKGYNRKVAVCHLGLSGYQSTWDLQKAIQSRLIREKRAAPEHHLPSVLLTVEHPPVYTLGKSGDANHLLVDGNGLSQMGATFVRIDRGGDITFHGPGQLVVYPILDLGHFYTDIHRYLRDLEEIVIRTCAHYGLEMTRIDGRTGVWTVAAKGEPPRKICSMGIKCSRWVTSHGLALNVETDLSYFSHIVPCGLPDADMTSISRELGRDVSIADVMPIFVKHFSDVFDAETIEYSSDRSHEFLAAYVSERVNS